MCLGFVVLLTERLYVMVTGETRQCKSLWQSHTKATPWGLTIVPMQTSVTCSMQRRVRDKKGLKKQHPNLGKGEDGRYKVLTVWRSSRACLVFTGG